MYPSRLPHEFEQMDWFAYMRMREVDRLLAVERKRMLQIEGKLNANDLTPEDWAYIEFHDELIDGNG